MPGPLELRQTDTVLIVSADAATESRARALVASVGYCPLRDVTDGAAGESIRRSRPTVALIDRTLPVDVVRTCLAAADETGARVVLISRTVSAEELVAEIQLARH